MIEATDRLSDFEAPRVQRLVETTLSGYEQTARSLDVASACEQLKWQFRRIASEDEKASDLQALQLARKEYLARLSDQERAANVFGALVQQISYNAQVLRDAAADRMLRAQLASACDAAIPTAYVPACTQLAEFAPQDLDAEHRLATQLVNRVASDVAHGDSR